MSKFIDQTFEDPRFYKRGNCFQLFGGGRVPHRSPEV